MMVSAIPVRLNLRGSKKSRCNGTEKKYTPCERSSPDLYLQRCLSLSANSLRKGQQNDGRGAVLTPRGMQYVCFTGVAEGRGASYGASSCTVWELGYTKSTQSPAHIRAMRRDGLGCMRVPLW